MAYFNYEVVREGKEHKVLAHPDSSGPGCTGKFDGFLVATVLEIHGPNPVIAFHQSLGIDGVEKVCVAVREAQLYKEEDYVAKR